MRLRVAWGGGDEVQRWSGQVALSEGTFSNIQLLGMEFDSASGIWQEGNVIHIDALRPHRFDGFDVTVNAADSARLVVELNAAGPGPPLSLDVPLAEAARQLIERRLDDKHSQLRIQRSPNDLLHIETDRRSLIYSPAEQCDFKLRLSAFDFTPGGTIDVATSLSRARGGEVLWSDQQPRVPLPTSGDFTAAVSVPLPRDEGVYTLHLTLTHPPGLRSRFLPIGGEKPLAERSFQVVVVDANAKQSPSTAETIWKPVLEIDPANPRWWQSLPSFIQRLPGVPRGPLGSIAAKAVDLPTGRYIELPASSTRSEPHWQAYPLPVERIGEPHLLEVEYPADEEQHFGLSIVEPNAAGRVVPIGRDSGVYVDGLGRGEQTERHTHRVVFWPRTNSPLLLVTNMHPAAAAHYGVIRVKRASGPLAAAGQQPPWQNAQRLVTAYLARPLVPETFGASEGLDTPTGQSVDDYQTFFESAQRLAAYLPFAGYNGAVVSVLADGSAIYPSRYVQSTPLYNTGLMVAGGNDLPPVDALELLLRRFDEQGLALLPSLQLAAPLPALELLRRRSNPQQSGIEWVGPEGRTWLESQQNARALAPYYNLLNESVQQSMLDVAGELVTRYGQHASLAGIAVQLSGDGYGELPGPSWGLDDATVTQFQRDTGVRLAVPEGPNRFAVRRDALLGPYADAWREWRAARVTQFYARLAALVQNGAPQRRLLLTTEEMFTATRTQSLLQPNVLAGVRLDRLMLDLGIDRQRLEKIPGVVFCPSQYIEPMLPLVDRAIDLEINEATAAVVCRKIAARGRRLVSSAASPAIGVIR